MVEKTEDAGVGQLEKLAVEKPLSSQNSINVLLVDDQNSFLELTSRYFEKSNHNANFTVKTYQNPEEVLEKAEEEEIDCIVSDYEMPRINGIELLKRIRQDHPDLPFILITSKGSEEVASKSISAGVTDYIQKGSGTDTFQLLINRIKNAVDKVRAEKERKQGERRMCEREEYISKLYRTMSSTETSFDEKLQKLFDLGCDFFNMELGAMAKVDPEKDRFKIERTSSEHEYFIPGTELRLSETYCTAAVEGEHAASVSNPVKEGYGNITVRQEFGIQSYIGSHLELDGGTSKTFFFVTSQPRSEPFSEAERTFHHMMAEWVKYELERRYREERLEEFTSIVSHDLKNPLTIAESYIELAERTQNVEDIQKASSSIHKAKRILKEVEAVPTTSNDLEKEHVSLEECFKEAYQNQDIETEYSVEDKKAYAGRLNLVKLFDKLIENSIEHNGPEIQVKAGPLENGFYYEDNGEGIPEDKREDVLKRGVTSGASQGLGLYIVKRIVDTHGWKLKITESESGGARFNFYTSK